MSLRPRPPPHRQAQTAAPACSPSRLADVLKAGLMHADRVAAVGMPVNGNNSERKRPKVDKDARLTFGDKDATKYEGTVNELKEMVDTFLGELQPDKKEGALDANFKKLTETLGALKKWFCDLKNPKDPHLQDPRFRDFVTNILYNSEGLTSGFMLQLSLLHEQALKMTIARNEIDIEKQQAEMEEKHKGDPGALQKARDLKQVEWEYLRDGKVNPLFGNMEELQDVETLTSLIYQSGVRWVERQQIIIAYDKLCGKQGGGSASASAPAADSCEDNSIWETIDWGEQ